MQKWGGGGKPPLPKFLPFLSQVGEKRRSVSAKGSDGARQIDEHTPGGVIGQGVSCPCSLLLCRCPLRFTECFFSTQISPLFPQALSRIADELPSRGVGVNPQGGVGSSSAITPLVPILFTRCIGVVCLTPRFS